MKPACLLLALSLLGAPLFGQARIEIVIGDLPGEGFNDPAPATPVGGNSGTTLGQQRVNVFRAAAQIWERELTSAAAIRVLAFFDPLPCTANSAALGAAGPFVLLRGFGAGRPGTWYPVALAEKLAGVDFDPFLPPDLRFEVLAVFNSELGKPGCLEGSGWYYGLDAAGPGNLPDLLTTVLHEFAHGVGFAVIPTNGQTGERADGFPAIWETRMLDLTQNKLWLNMNDAERQESAMNTNNLVWAGGETRAAIPSVLSLRPELRILEGNPPGAFEAQAATFGNDITTSGVAGDLMPAIDQGGESATDACEPLTPQSAFSVNGRIALVDRGTCLFTVKALNVQRAGAIGMVVVNNLPGLPSVGGADPAVGIPVIGIPLALGETLREQLRFRGRSVSPVRVSIARNAFIRSGTSSGLARLYAPNPYQPGSSVSHWDVSMDPNQLMEPFATPDIGLSIRPPQDLTLPLLRDIGW